MVDIVGPTQTLGENNTPATAVIRASELEPALFYCSYMCHEDQDPTNNVILYNFELNIDILGECSDDTRERITLIGPSK